MKIGFIYLLFAFPRCVFKVGVTISPQRRVRDINESVKRQLIFPIFLVLVFDYEDREERLHNIFKRKRFTYRGSGKTEYFRLNIFQVVGVVLIMLLYQLESIIRLGVFAGIAFVIIWIIRNL